MFLDALLRIPPVSLMSKDEAGADVLGCFAPDTASYDKTLGPIFLDALLRIPPVGLLYKKILLGPVYVDALLLIPPVTLEHIV